MTNEFISVNKRLQKTNKQEDLEGLREETLTEGWQKEKSLERDICAGGSCFLSFISLSSRLSDLQEQEWTMPRLWSLPALWRSWPVMIWTRRPKWCVTLVYACIWANRNWQGVEILRRICTSWFRNQIDSPKSFTQKIKNLSLFSHPSSGILKLLILGWWDKNECKNDNIYTLKLILLENCKNAHMQEKNGNTYTIRFNSLIH